MSEISLSEISITSIPFGTGFGFSISSAALYTPTSLIIGTLPSGVSTVILICCADTSLVLQRRFAPMVLPSSNSVQFPSVPSRYSTLYLLILCPFLMASSIETTSKFVFFPKSIRISPLWDFSSVVQYVLSSSSTIFPGLNVFAFPLTEETLTEAPCAFAIFVLKVSLIFFPNSSTLFRIASSTFP